MTGIIIALVVFLVCLLALCFLPESQEDREFGLSEFFAYDNGWHQAQGGRALYTLECPFASRHLRRAWMDGVRDGRS